MSLPLMDEDTKTWPHPHASPTFIRAPNGSDNKTGRLVLPYPDGEATKLDGGGGFGGVTGDGGLLGQSQGTQLGSWPQSSSLQTLAGSVTLPLIDWQATQSLLLSQIPWVQKGETQAISFYSCYRSTSLNVGYEKPRTGSNTNFSD